MKPSELNKDIDEVLASKTLPSHLATPLNAIRAVGTFAAHPIKSTNTGEITCAPAKFFVELGQRTHGDTSI